MRRADNIDKIVGDNVRALRVSRGMSQSELGSGIGIAFQQVQKYEKGQNRVSAGRLYRIAKFFNVPIASLYNGLKGPSGDGASPLGLVTRRDASRLLDAFSKISDRPLRRAIVTLVERSAVVR